MKPLAGIGGPYCRKCGAACTLVGIGRFDVNSGEELGIWTCPVDECGHSGRFHEWGGWLFFERCKKCGRSLIDD